MQAPRTLFTLLIAAALAPAKGTAQNQGALLSPPVDYLTSAPEIDGKLDARLERLPVRKFDSLTFSGQEVTPAGCTYRLAYTAQGLYLYIEVGKRELAGRDRAYQNGDGFHMILGIPSAKEGEGTREFYVLAFSPLDSTRRGKFIWYRNVDLAFTPLRLTKMAVGLGVRGTGIEIFLPWNEVYPYHPWLQQSIGFNLCFVEAAGGNDKINHFVLLDQRLQSEQSPRLYRTLMFAPPPPGSPSAAYLTLVMNHIVPGDTIRAVVAGVDSRGKARLVDVMIKGADSVEVFRKRMFVALGGTPKRQTVAFGRLDAPPGKYTVSWSVDEGACQGTARLTVLPAFSPGEVKKRIDQARGELQPGSVSSLQFLSETAAASLEMLKPYETGEEVRGTLKELMAGLEAIGRHHDYFDERRGVIRRAYRSAIDSTLQPYTVRIPESYNSSRRYPLLVYLHGSGEDDRGHFDRDTADDGFIRLAPSGRGTSNAYTADHAQEDIQEAIESVCSAYSIDSSHIILSGFSMGGYGVYRTFFETPRRFAALAVFSGSPDMGKRWIGPEQPDFLDTTLLRSFRGIPIFVYHGDRDRNCPVEQTEELVGKLRAAGAVVEYHLEPGKGHESPGPNIAQAYRRWLKSMTDR